jgi:hypothetical protein
VGWQLGDVTYGCFGNAGIIVFFLFKKLLIFLFLKIIFNINILKLSKTINLK